MTNFVTVISYCSNERFYIRSVLENAVKYSGCVVVSMGDHLYDGRREEESEHEYLIEICREISGVSNVMIVPIVYQVTSFNQPYILHNFARQAGMQVATEMMRHQPFWVFLLDADEVPDGDAVKQWLDAKQLRDAGRDILYKMSNYWVFMHPQLVSKEYEDSIVLVHSDMLNHGALTHIRERDGIYIWHHESVLGNKGLVVERGNLGFGKEPMFWHFSWVRSVDGFTSLDGLCKGLISKVSNWGHKQDRDWKSLISDAFSKVERDLSWPTHDFVHGHELEYHDSVPRCLCSTFQIPSIPIAIPKNDDSKTN